MKYYKIVEQDQIVGVITSNSFIAYSPIPDCYVSATEVTGEYVSYKNKLYRSSWMQPIKQECPYTEALIISITREEYKTFIEALKAQEYIENAKTQEEEEEENVEQIIQTAPVDPIEQLSIDFIRSTKIKEMSLACRTTIETGFDLELRGETHHFSLDTQDQLNLISLSAMMQTQELIPYHADGEECIFYTAAEMNQIVATATQFKIYHTTYYNALKTYINALDTIEAIAAITYGTPIPEEYQSDVLKALNV